jgi:hypothetical protein
VVQVEVAEEYLLVGRYSCKIAQMPASAVFSLALRLAGL